MRTISVASKEYPYERKSPEKIARERDQRIRDIELEEQIRLRAYELYETRGRQDGHEMEDWLQAETELKEKTAHRIAA